MNQTQEKLKSTSGFCLKLLINHILHNTDRSHLGNPKIKTACRAQWWVNAGNVRGQAVEILEATPKHEN